MLRPINSTWGRLLGAAMLLLALGVGLAACGGGSSSSSSSSAPAETTGSESSGSGGEETTAEETTEKATGSPIKIMASVAINNPLASWPGTVAAGQTAAIDINEHGGVNGHPIEIINCDNHLTPNGEATCGRKAVSENVVAYTGISSLATASFPIIEKAGIPASLIPSEQEEVTNPINFPLTGSGFTVQISLPYAVKEAGVKEAAIVYNEFGEEKHNAELATEVAEKLGIKIVKTISVEVTQTTFGDVAAQLQETGAEGVILIGSPIQQTGIIQAATAIGFQPKIWSNAYGAFNPELVKAMGEVTTAGYMTGTVPPANDEEFPAMAEFNEQSEVAAEQGVENTQLELRDENAVLQWLTIHMLAHVAEGIKGEVTSASMKKALEGAKNVDIEGLFEWSPSAPGLKLAPNIKDGGLIYWGPIEGSFFKPESKEPVPVLEELGF